MLFLFNIIQRLKDSGMLIVDSFGSIIKSKKDGLWAAAPSHQMNQLNLWIN